MATRVLRALGKGVDHLSMAGGTFAGIIMLIAALITVYEIIVRYVFHSPTTWTLEITMFILIWFGFIAMACAQKEGKVIHLDILVARMSPHTRAVWQIVTLVFSLIFVGIFTYYGYGFVADAVKSRQTTIGVFVAPLWIPKLGIVAGGGLLLLQLIKDIVARCYSLRTTHLKHGGRLWDNPVFLITIFIICVASGIWLYQISPVGGLLFLLLTLVFAGVPIFAALGMAGIVGLFMLYGGENALYAMPIMGYGALYNFSLACLPMFIIAGQLLVVSGTGQELYDLCDKWVGHLPGGAAIATIIACAVFAAISISSLVVAVTIGLVALPALAARKYDKRFSYGLLTAGGTLGIMIPPSGTMIIYSMVTDESIGKLFIAGLIPGVILVIMFIAYTIYTCSRGGYERVLPYSWKERFAALKTGVWGLLAPVIIAGGIYSGLFTVLEAGAVVAIYALVMSLARRKIKLAQLPKILGDSAVNASSLLIIIVGALVLGLFMTMLNAPTAVVNAITASQIPGWAVIIILMLIYIVMGMFLETISIMMITLPIVYPLIISLGFDGIWFAVMMTLNMEMALITPPVGLNLYVVKGVANAPITDVIKGVVPFFIIMVIGIIIFGFFPILSTWLPGIYLGR